MADVLSNVVFAVVYIFLFFFLEDVFVLGILRVETVEVCEAVVELLGEFVLLLELLETRLFFFLFMLDISDGGSVVADE